MSYVIDIKTRFIPDNQRVFMLFPGEGYRFYAAMRDNSKVFLDIPGFMMPDTSGSQSGDFVARLAMSERIKKWHAQGRPEDQVPPRALDAGYRITDRRTQLAGKVRNFYFDLRRGDIIIVPCQSYDDDVLFGEIIDDGPVESIQLPRYGSDLIPTRKVRWIKRYPRSKIPFWLERKIPTPNPVQQIELSYFKDIFEIMYQRYLFKDQFVCKYSVTSDEFSVLDNFLLQQILLYVAALHARNRDGNLGNVAALSINDVVAGIQFSADIPTQRIQIQSPGHLSVYARNFAPIVAAVLMTLAASGAIADSTDLANLLNNLIIANSADHSAVAETCKAEIKQEVLGDLVAMGFERWQELCQLEESTRQRTGLNSGVSMQINPIDN